MHKLFIFFAMLFCFNCSGQKTKTSTNNTKKSENGASKTPQTEETQTEETDKVKKYNYGKNGIESIVYRKGKPTILISNFNARPELVKEIVNLVQAYFMKNLEMRSGLETSFKAKKAEVFGKIIILKSKTAIDVQFHYEKVVWKSGLVEVYEKPAK